MTRELAGRGMAVLSETPPAPEFELSDVKGCLHSLKDFKGKILLLSFVQAHKSFEYDKTGSTRAQLNFLKSIYLQYKSRGLKVLVIESGCITTSEKMCGDELLNFYYDCNLDEIPVLVDNTKLNTAGRYNISLLPTTFLIAPDGSVSQRWDGTVLSPQLALALEETIRSVLKAAGNITSGNAAAAGGENSTQEYPRCRFHSSSC